MGKKTVGHNMRKRPAATPVCTSGSRDFSAESRKGRPPEGDMEVVADSAKRLNAQIPSPQNEETNLPG